MITHPHCKNTMSHLLNRWLTVQRLNTFPEGAHASYRSPFLQLDLSFGTLAKIYSQSTAVCLHLPPGRSSYYGPGRQPIPCVLTS